LPTGTAFGFLLAKTLVLIPELARAMAA